MFAPQSVMGLPLVVPWLRFLIRTKPSLVKMVIQCLWYFLFILTCLMPTTNQLHQKLFLSPVTRCAEVWGRPCLNTFYNHIMQIYKLFINLSLAFHSPVCVDISNYQILIVRIFVRFAKSLRICKKSLFS